MNPLAGIGVLAEQPHPVPAGCGWVAIRAAGLEPPTWMVGQVPIVQAEGPQQLEQALGRWAGHPLPKALVCNDTVRVWPEGWLCIPEAYTSTNPNATADQMTRDFLGRGATAVMPCILCSDEGHRMSVADYLPALKLARDAGAVGFSVFVWESMAPGDFDTLATLGAFFDHQPPPPPPAPPPPSSGTVVRAEMERLARSWERVQGGDLRRTRIQVARRIVDANNTDPFWTRCARDIAVLLDRAGVPK